MMYSTSAPTTMTIMNKLWSDSTVIDFPAVTRSPVAAKVLYARIVTLAAKPMINSLDRCESFSMLAKVRTVPTIATAIPPVTKLGVPSGSVGTKKGPARG